MIEFIELLEFVGFVEYLEFIGFIEFVGLLELAEIIGDFVEKRRFMEMNRDSLRLLVLQLSCCGGEIV